MTGKSHFRVRGVTCGKCSRIHAWYKYRVWREGEKVKEEYIGKCDQFGNMAGERSTNYHKRQRDQAKQQAYTNVRHYKTPYDVLGITYRANKAEMTTASRNLAKNYP